MAADDHPVADVHFAGERHAVGDHAVAADDAVVPDVDVGHQQVFRADARGSGRGGSAADGHVLADVVVVADFAGGDFAGEFQVLRKACDRSGGVDAASLADARPVVDHGSGTDPAVVADHRVARDIGKWFHRDVGSEFGVGVDIGQVADHFLYFLFLTTCAIITASQASVSPTNALASTRATPRRMGSSRWISNCSVSPGTTLRLNFTPSIFIK